ncbi:MULTISPECIES: hypothetical protein [Brasilonema]|nr:MULTISPECIES: hypothetical protein [Brasilonema]
MQRVKHLGSNIELTKARRMNQNTIDGRVYKSERWKYDAIGNATNTCP